MRKVRAPINESNGHYGKCSLCGKEGFLTFEHIPPRAAFNKTAVKTLGGDALLNHIGDDEKMPWEIEDVESNINQRGSGLYSLCEECNNLTGHWYGSEYVKLAQIAAQIITADFREEENAVEISSVYPLRFIKQILSMFCSISKSGEKMQPIRDFVLDRDAVGLPRDKYKLCMYFTRSNMSRQFADFVICLNGPNGTQIQLVSEITAIPMGFILYFDPKADYSYKGFDITSFADCHYCSC